MDHRSFAVLVIRLTGLVVITAVLLSFPGLYLHVAAGKGDYGGLEPVLLLFAGALLIGAILLAWPGRIADRMVGAVGGSGGTGPGDRAELGVFQEVALVSIGVYLVAESLLDAAYFTSNMRLYYMLMPSGLLMARPDLPPEDFAAIVAALMRFAIGLGLVLGARGGARVIARLRA